MNKKKRFIGLKTQIMISTLIPIVVSFSLISSVILVSLFNSLHETAEIEFLRIVQKHAINFESKINNALNYLAIVASTLELQVETDSTDREMLQKTILNATLSVEVSDSGAGIKAEDMDKLFGDFIQVDAARNKGIEGTGHGLAIARNLCRMMGGNITVDSEYEKGRTFSVTLPQKLDTYLPFASVSG